MRLASRNSRCAGNLMITAPPVVPDTPSEEVLDHFLHDRNLHALPVVDRHCRPIGIINRLTIIDRFSRIFVRELYGRYSCTQVMDPNPLVVDHMTPLVELSELVVDKGRKAFSDGFIITENGLYLGLGSGYDLMREITEMQIIAARYANPLTGLPGNVPIAEQVEARIAAGERFSVAYCDLDHFKPFNDVYGFRSGDAIIRLLGRILMEVCDSKVDFIGHIGGDDFIVLFGSDDWERRCHEIIRRFDEERMSHFRIDHIEARGYDSEDRCGNLVFHPLTALSIGAIVVEHGDLPGYPEISEAAAEAKKMAKRTPGSSLFVERRQLWARSAAGVRRRQPGESWPHAVLSRGVNDRGGAPPTEVFPP